MRSDGIRPGGRYVGLTPGVRQVVRIELVEGKTFVRWRLAHPPRSGLQAVEGLMEMRNFARWAEQEETG